MRTGSKILFWAFLAIGWQAFAGEADPELGERVYGQECARCHGANAMGGKDGEYPRLAGLPSGYLALQLANFRDRKRKNKPMLPIFKAGRLRRDQIEGVAAWLSTLPAPDAADLGIPEQAEGDLELGEELYVTDCALCHGFDGRGKEDTDNPPVVAQYPRYVIKQMVDFRNGRRWHEYGEALFAEAEPEDLDAMVAYILYLNHNPPTP